MNFFNDLLGFIKSLTVVDIVFFVAILVLIILIVTMIYIIRINSNEEEQNKIEDNKFLGAEDFGLQDEGDNIATIEKPNDETNDLIDLKAITKALEESPNSDSIDLTKYEEEQEDKAIISYDELLEKTGQFKINYEDINNDDGVSVKKIDLDNLVDNTIIEDNKNSDVRVVSYQHEEEFLKALKNLQNMLS